MIKETSPIYWAAFIDGEGWIGAARHVRKGRSRYDFELIVGISITLGKGAYVLDELKEGYGGYTRKREKRNPRWINVSEWHLRGRRCEKLLVDILPYLKIKRRQAELVLEFIGLSKEDKMAALYPDVKQRQIEIYNELRLLNAKGKTEPIIIDMKVTDGKRKYVKFAAEDLRRMYWDEKMSMVDIAKKFGVSFSAVKGNFDRFGIPRRSRSVFAKMGSDRSDKIKLFASKEKLFRAYVTEGKSLRAVGREFGVSHVQVLKALRRYEIPRRDRVKALKSHFKIEE